MSKTVVYLSGPITRGDRSHNVCQFMQAHEILLDQGYAVINPGLTGLIPWAWEKEHSVWLESDLPLVERSDLVIRLPGESIGGDMETAHAKAHGIPVIYISDLSQLERMEPHADSRQPCRQLDARSNPAAERSMAGEESRSDDSSNGCERHPHDAALLPAPATAD